MTTQTASPVADAPSSSAKLVQGKSLSLPTGALALDAHSDGKKIYAACLDGVYESTIETGAHRLIGKHETYASGVRYLSKLGQVVSAGFDGTIRWHDPVAGKEIRKVDAHKFWSWKMRVSPDEQLVASVTGQYLAGGYKYEPHAELDPSVKVYETATGNLRWALPHVPPVLSVAFSPDSRHLAAANLVGEIRVYDLTSGKQVASWTTPDFTCWGIIKSHCYIGGIYGLTFSPDGKEVVACGMGPMVDPMSGNGKMTWQRFAWGETPARKVAEIHEGESGGGLMEVINYHPDGSSFLMAGRMAVGKWNTALFDSASGRLLQSFDTKMRTTDALWLNNGTRLAVSGATSQDRKVKGVCPDFGHIKLFDRQA